MTRKWSATDWPIAAAMIPFPGLLPDGRAVQDCGPEVWAESLQQVADAGFTAVDPTDSWLRIADLEPARRAEFLSLCKDLGLSIPAISTSRRSVIDPALGEAHLAYSHRVIDTAAEIGAGAVSFGFFGPLTPAQQKATWFWTVDGQPKPQDPAVYQLALSRIRSLCDHAASLGVELSLEMYEDTYLGTAAEAVRFMRDLDHPAAKLNIDIGNLIRLHRPVETWQEMIAACIPYAGYWHVKNYYRMEDSTSGAVLTHPAPLESGTINWRRAIRDAIALGFNSAFLLEHYGGDGLSVCAQNQAYLRRILPKG